MYIRFTPKQLSILKNKLLPTVKLNAYDIQIYQEIQRALDNPIDEKQKSFSSNKPNNTTNKQTFKPLKNIKPNYKFKEKEKEEVNQEQINKQKTDYVNSIKTEEKNISEELEELEDMNEEEQESIFSVIDSRTKISEE